MRKLILADAKKKSVVTETDQYPRFFQEFYNCWTSDIWNVSKRIGGIATHTRVNAKNPKIRYGSHRIFSSTAFYGSYLFNRTRKQKHFFNSRSQSDGISIQNIGGVFIVIFVGIGMACATLLFEFWYYRYRIGPQVIDVSEANPSKSDSTSKLNNMIERHYTRDTAVKNTALRPRNTHLANSTYRTKY